MHPALAQDLVAQHVAELHRQAARQRLVHELRTRQPRPRRRRRPVWDRLPFRRPRPATT